MAIYPQMQAQSQPVEHRPQQQQHQQQQQQYTGDGYGRKPRRYRKHRRRRTNNRGGAGSESEFSWADTASVSSSSDSGSNNNNNNNNGSQYATSKRRRRPNACYPRQVQVGAPAASPMIEDQLKQYVALDCEMVGIGVDGKQSALARVTLIDWFGTILIDEYVQQQCEVTDYRTFVSGITPGILCQARMDFATCQHEVLQLLEGKVLVGHGLKNDLRVLGVSHPWYMTRDTAKYEPFMKVRFDDGVLWPRALKDLSQEHLHRDIQVHGKPHCPYEDALAALDLYRRVLTHWEKCMEYKLTKTRAIEQGQQPQYTSSPSA